jgi:hypothetical protein
MMTGVKVQIHAAQAQCQMRGSFLLQTKTREINSLKCKM